MSEPKPDWSKDPLIKPWRKGRVELPFTTTERSEAETQKRVLTFAAVTAAVCSLTVFGIFVWAGLYPEIYTDPRITEAGDRTNLHWFILGGGAAGGLALLVFLSPLLFQTPQGGGHPWTFEATEEGLTVSDIHGRVWSGPWAEWTLKAYDVLHLPKGGEVLSVLYLGFRDGELPVRLFDQRHQRRFMRLVVQRIAELRE